MASVGGPAEINVACGIDCGPARQRRSGPGIGIHLCRGEGLSRIMRGRNKEFFFVVEAHVNIRPAHRQHRPVGLCLAALRPGKRPGSAEVERAGDHNVALIVLHPRRVYGLPVHRINHDLRIELAGRQGKQRPRRLPRNSIVAAHQQRHGRGSTAWTIGDGTILRIENVDVPVTVGGDCGFPLITGAVADASLRRESRDRQRRLACRQSQQQQKPQLLCSSWPGLEVAGRQKHGTDPLANPSRTLP